MWRDSDLASTGPIAADERGTESRFRLGAVADRSLYLDAVKETEYLSDIKPVIHKTRLAIGRVRPWRSIPV